MFPSVSVCSRSSGQTGSEAGGLMIRRYFTNRQCFSFLPLIPLMNESLIWTRDVLTDPVFWFCHRLYGPPGKFLFTWICLQLMVRVISPTFLPEEKKCFCLLLRKWDSLSPHLSAAHWNRNKIMGKVSEMLIVWVLLIIPTHVVGSVTFSPLAPVSSLVQRIKAAGRVGCFRRVGRFRRVLLEDLASCRRTWTDRNGGGTLCRWQVFLWAALSLNRNYLQSGCLLLIHTLLFWKKWENQHNQRKNIQRKLNLYYFLHFYNQPGVLVAPQSQLAPRQSPGPPDGAGASRVLQL